jgi:hypothetical protein
LTVFQYTAGLGQLPRPEAGRVPLTQKLTNTKETDEHESDSPQGGSAPV